MRRTQSYCDKQVALVPCAAARCAMASTAVKRATLENAIIHFVHSNKFVLEGGKK